MKIIKDIVRAFNVMISDLFFGKPNYTISARTYEAARNGYKVGIILEKVINRFFWVTIKQDDHCYRSWKVVQRKLSR